MIQKVAKETPNRGEETYSVYLFIRISHRIARLVGGVRSMIDLTVIRRHMEYGNPRVRLEPGVFGRMIDRNFGDIYYHWTTRFYAG